MKANWQDSIIACPNCPNYGPQVGSKGDPNSPFVIIGESPGKNELKEREPFVGASGKVLQLALRECPVEPYFINALQCYPGPRDDKNEAKMVAACQSCRHHVLEELGKAPRKVILCLGGPALWSITNNYDLKITQERGKVFPTEFATHGMIPSVHPAFLMTGGKGGTPQQFFRDCQYAIDLLNGKPAKRPPAVNYHVASSVSEINDFSAILHDVGYVAGDIETSDLQPLRGRILCAGFAWHANHVFVIPEEFIPYTGRIFDTTAKFIWHNGQFDIKWLHYHGIPEARIDEDTILLSYALDENGGIHGLEQVSSDWLNSPNWKGVLDEYLPKKNSSYSLVPRDILQKYMSYDIGNTRAVFDILRPKVAADPHLEKLYTRTLIPATRFLAKVEANGLYVDLQRLKENEVYYDAEVNKAADAIREIGKQFPDSPYTEKLPGSWQQIQRLLYDDLKIKPYKGRRSTDAKVLDQLPPHPAITTLRRHRKVAKERGTYVTSLGTYKDPKTKAFTENLTPRNIQPDGCVHSSLALFKTRTGRLASSDPNVQNVPRNPQIRGQYVARPGRRFIEVDLNQAELRVLATLSGDPELCRIYLTAGMSLHDEVRAEIWGYPKDWTPTLLDEYLDKFRLTHDTRFDKNNGDDLLVAEQKMRAKNVNFGTVYGITASGLAEQCDCSVEDAQLMINAWFRKFNKAGEFINACKQAPFKGRTLLTAFGRKKRPGIVSSELAQGIQNEYANFPEQSPASDATLHAGIELEESLRIEHDTIIVNLIHDAILAEAPDDDNVANIVAAKMIAKMQDVPKIWGFRKIPFVAEAKQGYRWGSLSKMKIAA